MLKGDSTSGHAWVKHPVISASIPRENFLIAANQSSGDVFTFHINQDTGELKPIPAIQN